MASTSHHIQTEAAGVLRKEVDAHEHPTEYEQLVGLASRVDQLVREVEVWLHLRERGAATAGARDRQRDWRRRRLAILRHSQALLTALLRDVEL